MTTLTTKTDVDQAKTTLDGAIAELYSLTQDWFEHPTDPELRRQVRHAHEEADWAAEDYETALATWATGPNGVAT